MMRDKRFPFDNPCATHLFLTSKPLSSPCKDEAPPKTISLLYLRNAAERYPRFIIGQTIIEEALIRLETVLSFFVIFFRMDAGETLGETRNENFWDTAISRICDAVDAACQQTGGTWGTLEDDIFACFVPQTENVAHPEFLENLRHRLKGHPAESLTAGIAVYPHSIFDRKQSAANARKALEHASFFRPGGTAVFDAVSLNISGDRFYQEGRIQDAIEEYKTALVLDPSNVNCHNSLGVCYGVLGAYPSALEAFETAIRLSPEDVMPPYNAGMVYFLKDDKSAALTYFQKAESIDPTLFETAFQMGRIYLDLEETASAKAYFLKALSIREDSSAVLRYLGECEMISGVFREAVRYFQKAVKRNPNDAASLSSLGFLFDRLDQNTEIALIFSEHSVQLSPQTGLFRQRLGELYLKRNRIEDALREFRQASALGCDVNRQLACIHSLKRPARENDYRKIAQ